jgi:putative FmdB family regulatory protein
MPMYVYACQSCGHGFEVRQRFDESPLAVCPECSGRIRRVIQPVGIVFKGSGFYKTDSRNSSSVSVPPGETVAPAATPATAPAATSNGASATASPALSADKPKVAAAAS